MPFDIHNYREFSILTPKGEAHMGELFDENGQPNGYSVYLLDPASTREIQTIEFTNLTEALAHANSLKSCPGCDPKPRNS